MKSIPSEARDKHVAILGKTGSGKTYAAKGIVEGLLEEGRQVCVLDPTSAWWGLRLGRDGKSRGHSVVLLGGEHADIPLSERSGPAVARLVTEQNVSAVLDTGAMHVGEYTRFFIDFAGTLYTTIKRPLHLIIDEAHYFMPQGKVLSPDAGKMLHAGNRLMSGGRSRGIRGMMITQRPAKLHKDSLTCADTLIAMRVVAPQDRKAVEDWIAGCGDPALGKQVVDSLAKLKRGEGWVWYPEGEHLKRVAFPEIATYDSSAAPTGERKAKQLGYIDLEGVKKSLAEAVKEAEANDPKLLRAKIAELQRELKAKPGAAQPVRDDAAIERAVAHERKRLAIEHTRRDAEWRRALETYRGRMTRIADLATQDGVKLPEQVTHREEGRNPVVALPTPKPHETRVAARAVAAPRLSGEGVSLPIGERKTLSALIQYPDGLKREQLTVLTGYKRSSRDAYIQRLREKGYVSTDGERIAATDDGIAALPDAEPLPTGEALREYWLARLPDGERKTLSVLIGAYPDSLPREQIDEATGYKRSSRDAYIQRLRAKELVESDGGNVIATSRLFDG